MFAQIRVDGYSVQMIELFSQTQNSVSVCWFWAGDVIGQFFFEEVCQVIAVYGELYRPLISIFYWAELDDMDLNNMWFQHDWISRCVWPQIQHDPCSWITTVWFMFDFGITLTSESFANEQIYCPCTMFNFNLKMGSA